MKTFQEMMEDTYSADYKIDVNGNKSKARRIAFDYGKDDKKAKEKDKKAEMDEGVIGAVAGGVLGAMAGPAGMAAGAYLGHKIQKGANKDDKKKVKKEEVEDMSMGEVIKDFQKSDAPQFKGKSKEKRRQMAIAAKLQSEEVMNEGSEERLNMIRKAAERVKMLQAKKAKQAERDAKRAMRGDKVLGKRPVDEEVINEDENPYGLYTRKAGWQRAHKAIHGAVEKAKTMSDKNKARDHVWNVQKKHSAHGGTDTEANTEVRRRLGMNEETISEAAAKDFNKDSKAHQAVKKATRGMGYLAKAEYHADGSATMHSKGNPQKGISPTNVVDSHHNRHGMGYNRSEKDYSNHKEKDKNGLTHHTTGNNKDGFKTHISESVEVLSEEFNDNHAKEAAHAIAAKHKDHVVTKHDHGEFHDGKTTYQVHHKSYSSKEAKEDGAPGHFITAHKDHIEVNHDDGGQGGGETKHKSVADAVKHASKGIHEAVGTAAKYAGKTGFMGDKYDSHTHAAVSRSSAVKKYIDKKRKDRNDQHASQDPKHNKAGYAKHMVDTNKAKKNAAKRGVDSSHLNWKHTNGVKRGKLPEEVEQIDELSKDTMTSYVSKAVNPKMGNTPADSKMTKRTAGIAKAVKKLAKEEVEQIDELNRDTIASYKKKATSSAVSNMIGGQGSVKTMDKRIRGIKMADKKLDQKKLGEAKDYNKDGKIDAHEKDHAKEMITFKNFDKRLKKIEKEEMKEATETMSYKTGYKAATYKKPVTDNPHPKGSEAHSQWAAGHDAKMKTVNEADNPPFDPPYKKVDKNAKPARNSDGSITSPMSKAKQLAKQAMKNAEKTVAQHKEGVEFDSDGTILEAKNKITFHQFMGATKKKKEKKGGDDMPLEQS